MNPRRRRPIGLPAVLAMALASVALIVAPRPVFSQAGAEAPGTEVGSLTLKRPEPDQILQVQSAPGVVYIMDFDASAAEVELAGTDFALTFQDGAQIVFDGLVALAEGKNPPVFRIEGADIGSDILVAQARSLSEGPAGSALETAAGAETIFQLEFKFIPFPQVRRARLGQ